MLLEKSIKTHIKLKKKIACFHERELRMGHKERFLFFHSMYLFSECLTMIFLLV